MRKVMAFGSFDLLHPGHLHYLTKAAGLGDSLTVVVARDESINALKGRMPIFNERERAEMVGSLSIVSKAVVGNKISKPTDIYKIIKQLRPNVIVFGYDQRVDVARLKEWLKANRIKAKVVRIRSSFNPSRFKSSKIRSRLFK